MLRKLMNTNGRLAADVQLYIKIMLGLPPDTKIGGRIGSVSGYGAIFELGNDAKKVIKVAVNKDSFRTDFNNEVRVGHIDGIEKVGTKIYQSHYGMFSEQGMYMGVYVMDHLKSGDANSQVITLRRYWTDHYGKSCPTTKDRVLKMYVDLIFQFYKVTKGWHADLHSDNIQVILRQDGTVRAMKVIDYGSHTPFKRNISGLTCLDDILDAINRNWKNLPPNPNMKRPFGPWPLVHKKPENKNAIQLVHANSAALRMGNMHPMYNQAWKRGLTGPPRPATAPHRLRLSKGGTPPPKKKVTLIKKIFKLLAGKPTKIIVRVK